MTQIPAAPSTEEEAPPKTGPKGVVLIGALLGSLLIGAAAGIFAVGPVLAKKSGFVVDHAAAGASADSSHAEGDSTASEGGAEGEGATANLHLIDNLVLNPAGTGGARFLMLAAAVEFKSAASVETFKARDAEVRDIVIRVMGARTIEELSEMANRELLKKELADSLGTLVKEKQAIRRIYFPQFVIQ